MIMNDAWKRIFKKYIDCHEAIHTLEINSVIDGDEADSHRNQLLHEIIETMKSEVGE